LAKPKRPKKEKSLIAHAKPFCGQEKSDESVAKTMVELKKAKLISIDEKGAVTYHL
jgi:hypothetical protein